MTDSQEQGALKEAGKIIERFGGIRPMASKMAVPVTTVQGWKKRDIIPENRREDVLRAAVVNNIDLSDLIDKKPANDTAASGAAAAPDKPAGRALVAEGAEQYDDSELKAWIKGAETRAVQKSMIVTMVLTALVTVLVIFILFPGQERLNRLEQKLAQEQAAGTSVMPQALQDSIEQLRQQVETLRHDLNTTAQRIDHATGMEIPGTNTGLLMDRVIKLEQQLTAMAGPGSLQGMSDRIRSMQKTDEGRKALEAAVADLTALVGPVQDPVQTETVLQQAPAQNAALDKLMAGVSAADIRAGVFLLIALQLQNAMEHSQPIDDDLALLQKILGKQDQALNDALAQLAPEAAKGVETPKQLADEFSRLSPQIVKVSLQNGSVAEKAKAGLGDIVQVHKDGDLITGTDTQAKLDRIQQMLEGKDIAGAVTALQALPDAQQKLAASFIEKARTTLMTQQLSAMLIQHLSRHLSAAETKAPEATPAKAQP